MSNATPNHEKPKHTMVVIGWLGFKRVYLDVPPDEAVRRYRETEGGDPPTDIDVFEFTDEFGAYDVWSL
jgi:hypothetical protein